MKIDRLFSIVMELLNRDKVPASELAKRFEVSVRTIYRDLEAVDRAGIPVVSYAGKNGGFGILPNFKLERQFLSFSEMVTIISSLRGIRTAFGDSEVQDAIGKIRSLVPQNRAEEFERREEQVVIDILPWGYREKERELLEKVGDAIRQCRLVEFDYVDWNNRPTRRVLEPMTAVFKGYAWYLFGYCRKREDYRIFRVSRIRNLETLPGIFERRSYTYREFEEKTEVQMPMTTVKLRFPQALRVRMGDYFGESSFEDDGEYFTVCVELPDNEWLDSFLLGFGSQVEILDPPGLRERIACLAGEICKHYGNG